MDGMDENGWMQKPREPEPRRRDACARRSLVGALLLLSWAAQGCGPGGDDSPDAAGQPPSAPAITSDLTAVFGDPQTLKLDNYASEARFTFASDGAAGFLCRLDADSAFTPCTSGAALPFPRYVDHELSVKAIRGGVASAPSTVYWRSAMACTGGPSCPEADLQATDPRSRDANLITGFADPALKAFQGAAWMAYSWPSSVWPNGVGSAPEVLNIQAHLAKSTDGGETWSFVGAQFGTGAAEAVNLGATNGGVQPGVASSEEIDIEAAMLGSPPKPYWFWIRQKYYNPVSGTGNMKGLTQHLRIGMLQADEPAEMGQQEANEFVFFSPYSPADFRAQVSATSRGHADLVADVLAAHGIDCDVQWSGSVLFHPGDGHLYVLVECNVVGANSITGTTFPVLRAKPTGAGGEVLTPDQWSWEFVGSIGTPSEGFTLLAPRFRVDPGGAPTNMLIQPSLTWGEDGALLLVSTPTLQDAAGDTHRLGCNVTELTLNPLGVARDAFGNPKHRAIVRTPDLGSGSTFGNQAGSCDYDRGIGLYQARKVPRNVTKTTSSIHRTGIVGL